MQVLCFVCNTMIHIQISLLCTFIFTEIFYIFKHIIPPSHCPT